MKVIIKKTGKIKNVPDGYARNYLLPKGLAVIATDDAVKKAESDMATQEADQKKQAQEWQKMAMALSEGAVLITMKANEDGTLFGKLSPSAILQAVQEQKQMKLEESWLTLPSDLKHVGKTEAQVRFPSGITSAIHLTIEAESQHHKMVRDK